MMWHSRDLWALLSGQTFWLVRVWVRPMSNILNIPYVPSSGLPSPCALLLSRRNSTLETKSPVCFPSSLHTILTACPIYLSLISLLHPCLVPCLRPSSCSCPDGLDLSRKASHTSEECEINSPGCISFHVACPIYPFKQPEAA